MSSKPRFTNAETGRLLAALRKRAGVTQQELAGAMRVRQHTVASWETGRCALGGRRMAEAADVLKLSPDDWNKFVLVRWPALDPNWRDAQPEDKRAVLLLVACRERAGLTQEELAEATGVNKQTIVFWEKGISSVSASKAAALAQFYRGLSTALPESKQWFGKKESDQLKIMNFLLRLVNIVSNRLLVGHRC
jgi:transcriptional regulator with XRE-family HTH domain